MIHLSRYLPLHTRLPDFSLDLGSGCPRGVCCFNDDLGLTFVFKTTGCGNSIAGDAHPVSDSHCDTPCSGNETEICGGYGYMNIYARKDCGGCYGGGGDDTAHGPPAGSSDELWKPVACYKFVDIHPVNRARKPHSREPLPNASSPQGRGCEPPPVALPANARGARSTQNRSGLRLVLPWSWLRSRRPRVRQRVLVW